MARGKYARKRLRKPNLPQRGSYEERRYYLTKEGAEDFTSYKDYDGDRAMELLFKDAPDVDWNNENFNKLYEEGKITEKERDQAWRITAHEVTKILHPTVKWYEIVLGGLFLAGPVSIGIWVAIFCFIANAIGS